MGITAIYCFLDPEEHDAVSGLLALPETLLIPLSCKDWNRDLSPWPARKAFAKGEDFSGGADGFLKTLTEEQIPKIEADLPDPVSRRFLAGYSLAGLFSLYAATKTGLFNGVASVSGSLWFDGFCDYLREHPTQPEVRRVYLSVGEREKNAREPRMKTVEDCTLRIEALLKDRGLETVFERNPGGHFTEPEQRLARGIRWLAGDSGRET